MASYFDKYLNDLAKMIVEPYTYPTPVYNDPTIKPYISYEPNPPFKNLLKSRYILQSADDFDFDWFIAQQNYMKSLSPRSRHIVHAYTRHGDEVVNAYLRNPSHFMDEIRVKEMLFRIMPTENRFVFAAQLFDRLEPATAGSQIFYNEDGSLSISGEAACDRLKSIITPANSDLITDLVAEYVLEFSAILAASPPLTRPIRVFRGVKTDYLENKSNPDIFWMEKGFLSTSMNPQTAFHFAENSHIVYEILILPSTRCLVPGIFSYFPHEYEIIVDDNFYGNSQSILFKKYGLNMYEDSSEIPPKQLWKPMPPIYASRQAIITHDELFSLSEASEVFRGGATGLVRPHQTRRQRTVGRSKMTASKKTVAATATKTRRSVRHRRMTPTDRTKYWKVRDTAEPLVLTNVVVPPHIKERLKHAMYAAYGDPFAHSQPDDVSGRPSVSRRSFSASRKN